jgi:endonuclease/exonuclease/phosphatase family metal-dependent hydrolase
MPHAMLFPEPAAARVGTPRLLEHDLNRHFPKLLKFDSTAELAASPIVGEVRDEAERILNSVVVGPAPEAPETGFAAGAVAESPGPDRIAALAWNIERGIVFDGIADALQNHDQLKDKDVLLLTELDHGMARSGNRFVARELAERLGLNYAFAPVYIALQKGSGVETEVEGENTASIHGLALFSKWPMRNVHAIPLPNGKDKMHGKEKRLGFLRTLIADIDHPTGSFRAATIHLDAHCSRAHRRRQMRIILDHLDTLAPLPTLIGGDWNTTTFNSQNARRAILGYWRRVMMGVKKVVRDHYPYPDRYFERRLFEDLEKRGFRYKELNEAGVGTIHYDVKSIEKNTNLRDWVPAWCFPFIFWAANRVGGVVSGRLDWFAGRGLAPAGPGTARTIGGLVAADGRPLSDHDPITVDFGLAKS